MLGWVKKIFGTAQSRTIKRYMKIVSEINEVEKSYQSLSDEELIAKTAHFRQRLLDGETTEDLLVEAYATVKNACRRLCGMEMQVFGYQQKWDMIPYDVQLIGGIAMHYGSIAEMQTGEGKTLTAAMPLYLHALTQKAVHLITVNDYLAARDCEWIGSIFRFLNLKVRALTSQTSMEERKEIYSADIVYGTASEFGFDYLRDNSMAQTRHQQCQRGHYFAIIDEVDSVLIDEARTPLIISGPAPASSQMYDQLKEPVEKLVRLQRSYCNEIAGAAKRTLDSLDLLRDQAIEGTGRLSKTEKQQLALAIEQLWLVSKGMPTHKILKRAKENPDIRTAIEDLETFYHSEVNKEEKAKKLSALYVIIDERASDFEITDKGITSWSADRSNASDDFVMLDLGGSYAEIDADTSLSEEEKLTRKEQLRSEDAARKEKAHTIRQLCRAHLLMEKDVDYIIQEGKVVIIDENTGRPQPGRRFSEGLHQAIEAKESLAIQGETQTYATITLQNYFRLYTRLAGMTGTASTEAHEFKEIYKLNVLAIPTHRTCIRKDFDDEIYMTEREKYQGILKEILAVHGEGRPILIGTDSVEASEKLSRILSIHKIPHKLLNAKNHAQEAEIISQAGHKNSVLVATNMAGRGTDIKLEEGVAALGGLFVLGTARHYSRRIDRQLRGRCARQGDPGSSKFFVSFEDEMMRRFNSPTFSALLKRYRPPEGEPLSAPILNRSIETAQKRIEQQFFSMRKHTLEYDDVMNKQRSEVYAFRERLLHEKDLVQIADEVLDQSCHELIGRSFYSSDHDLYDEHRLQETLSIIMQHYPLTLTVDLFQDILHDQKAIEPRIIGMIHETFHLKIDHQIQILKMIGEVTQRQIDAQTALNDVLRSMLLRCTDHRWQEHLQNIDHLRAEVSMRSVGQKDPLMEFKQEAFALFDQFRRTVYLEMAHALFSFQLMLPQNPKISPLLASAQKESY